ncbi:hypothetical protein KEM55_007538 [Ascosphaera atra]|nr:hypothetical protein KEM55_007538 [Ascosphaera atra]
METATATAAEETPIHSLDDWRTLFLGEEAREVRDVIGAIIICVQRPTEGMVSSSVPGELVPQNAHELCERRAQTLKDAVRAVADVKELIEEERGGLGEVPGLLVVLDKEEGRTGQAVGSSNDGEDRDEGSAEQPQTLLGSAWWDEELSQMGIFEFEVIGWDPEAPEIKGAKNEFGGMHLHNPAICSYGGSVLTCPTELQGMERCMQVLETHEWDAPPEDDDTEPNQDGPTRPTPQGMIRPDTFNMAGEANFDTDVDGLDFEMAGLHMSLMQEEDMDDRAGVADNDGGEEFQVEQLEGLMGRVQALKGMP